MILPKMKPFTILIGLHVLLLALAVGLLIRQKTNPPAGKEKIAVLTIEGVITNESGSLGRGLSVDSIVDAINDFRDDDDTKALVLRIDSPGGSVGSVQEIYSALKKFRAKGKFIVSSFGDISASGGYYVASLSDKIYSQPGTLTGSIGVIMEIPNVQGLMSKVGVTMNTIKSGTMKDSGSPFRTMTSDEHAYFSSVIMDAYDQFFTAVKEGRKMTAAQLTPLADGRVFSGRQALEKNLVDSLGDLEDAIDEAKKMAGLQDKSPEIIYHDEKPSLERLLDLVSQSPLKNLPLFGSRHKSKLMYVMP